METRLDERFSDPGTEATGWAETTRALEEAQISWLTTVRADGRPHVTPLVAVWLDGAVHFSTGATEQKYLNLTANPNVVLTTGRTAWEDALDVVVGGVARRVTDSASGDRLAADSIPPILTSLVWAEAANAVPRSAAPWGISEMSRRAQACR